MGKGKKLYVGNPLGFSDAGRFWLKERLLPKLSALGFEIINPWEYAMEMDSSQLRKLSSKMPRSEAIMLGDKNAQRIRGSDIFLAVLDGADVDSGTAAEIGYAYALGKRIIGYRGDFRLSTDIDSCTVNLQIEAFIDGSGGKICATLEEVIDELRRAKG